MKAPSFYVYLQMKLFEHSSHSLISISNAKNLLAHYSIPKRLRSVVLKELEILELIKLDDDLIQIINIRYQSYNSLNRITRRNHLVKEMLNGKEDFFQF